MKYKLMKCLVFFYEILSSFECELMIKHAKQTKIATNSKYVDLFLRVMKFT